MADGVTDMFSFKEIPWHRKGKVVADALNSYEAMAEGGLNWESLLYDLISVENHLLVDDNYRVATGYKSVVRSDTRAVLGVVSNSYKPVNNAEAFAFMDSLVGPGRQLKYHTAGCLWGGKKVWMLAKLDKDIIVKGRDVVNQFLLLSNSHDGKSKLHCFFTPVRVVCANTLKAAFEGRVNGVAISHRGNIQGKIVEAQKILGLSTAYFDDLGGIFNNMANVRMNSGAIANYFKKLYPDPEPDPIDDEKTDKQLAAVQKTRTRLAMLFDGGIGHQEPGIRGTVYTAYNAVTQFVDHERENKTDVKTCAEQDRRDDTRLESMWFGSGAAIKAQAFNLSAQLIGKSMKGAALV